VRRFLRRVVNMLWYDKWTDCTHGKWPEEWEMEGFAEWRCRRCGVIK
jgi:hypothetical protein